MKAKEKNKKVQKTKNQLKKYYNNNIYNNYFIRHSHIL